MKENIKNDKPFFEGVPAEVVSQLAEDWKGDDWLNIGLKKVNKKPDITIYNNGQIDIEAYMAGWDELKLLIPTTLINEDILPSKIRIQLDFLHQDEICKQILVEYTLDKRSKS